MTQSKRTKTRKRTIFEKADDPDRRDQAIGYDYLADETGVQLEPPADRPYHPPHVDDGGLWMFDLGRKAGAEGRQG
ncbi:hypothetical protein IG197_05090 [Aminobacter sp. SR38]|uniref:hypothetical protein n=1 Tax=Aminobacter sp. SR38 TaxID=2774562 RepID=UPI0017818B71|nr:hypothetical protein [Aminobacter sp. SR38]QOF72455.1 hypothetical protein IG197_05090 [Aminobacter sp. SR38]